MVTACINNIIIRLPAGLKDRYDANQNIGIFDNDGTSDRLILRVLPEDYNVANPVIRETKQSFGGAYTTVTRNLYKLEASDKDKRAAIKKYVLRDLLETDGNLSLYGITNQSEKDATLIAIEDYHELDLYEDELAGYTLRVGTMVAESLKGSYRGEGTNYNFNQGVKIIFTQTHRIVNNSLQLYVPNN